MIQRRECSRENNTYFPSEIMSGLTTKEVLGKWCESLYQDVFRALYFYYMREGNADCGDMVAVHGWFERAYKQIEIITPVLHDLVVRELCGLEDIFIAVYGITSDSVYALREFQRLYKVRENWRECDMWNDCVCDERLKRILTGCRKT